MTEEFTNLIGQFIHNCGALEYQINNSIKALADDGLLAINACTFRLDTRISLLRQLLRKRTEINKDDIKSFCDELLKIARKRNIVAHNPIVSTIPNESGEQHILNLKKKRKGVTLPDKLTKDDLSELVHRSLKLNRRFGELGLIMTIPNK